jgi:hypothetical protein
MRNVKGIVATDPIVRDVKSVNQGFVRLAIFELKDETGRVLVLAWKELAGWCGVLVPGAGFQHQLTSKNPSYKLGESSKLSRATNKPESG